MLQRDPGPRVRRRLSASVLAVSLLALSPGAARAGTLTAVAPSGATPGVTIQISGAGFAPAAADNEVTFAGQGGASVTVAASSATIVDAATGRGRVLVRVPEGLPVGPVALSVANRATGEVSQGRSIQLIDLSLGAVRSARADGSVVEIEIVGSPNALFVPGGTRVVLGEGVTVESVAVDVPTRLRASVRVARGAAPGPRTVAFNTSQQMGTLSGAFSVLAPPVNAAPTVNAGPDRAITQPVSLVELAGSVADDGLPAGSSVAVSWTQVGGPAAVGFSNVAAPVTVGTFPAVGTYELRLTATDGTLSASDTVLVVVSAAAGAPNRAPEVGAAAAPAAITLPVSSVSLIGTATDDGQPPASTLGYQWSKVSGPGAVSFAAPNAPTTTATFALSGTYVLRLDVSDGVLTGTAQATVQVNPAPPPPAPVNAAPIVAATATPASITLPANLVTLVATATDDGRPEGSALSYRWSTLSGPAPATFDTPSAKDSVVRFTTAGQYTLQLRASDGQDSAVATVVVAVNPGAPPPPENRAPIARAGGPYAGDATSPVAFAGRGSSDPDGDPLTYAWDFGDGQQADGPSPVHTYASAGTYPVTLTVTDSAGASSRAATSAVIGPPADRAPPAVTLTAPSKVLPGEDVTVTAEAADNDRVEAVAFTVDGAAPTTVSTPPYERRLTVPSVAQPGTVITVRAAATDPSGNTGVATARLTVVAVPDTSVPTISLSGPGTASPGQVVVVTAAAADDVGVASVRFLQGAQLIGTDVQGPFSAIGTIPAGAAVGSAVVFTARAADFAGNTADATHTVTVVAAPDEAPPTITLTAPAQVVAGATIPLAAQAADGSGIARVTFFVNGVPAFSDTEAPYGFEAPFPPGVLPGGAIAVTATATDLANLSASDGRTVVVAAVGSGSGLVVGEVYDDTTGLPMPGVRATLSTSAGERSAVTDARGRYAIVVAAGPARLRLEKAGFTLVERPLVAGDRTVVEALDARLTPLGRSAEVDPSLDATIGDGDVSVSVVAGALAARQALWVTRVGPQGLKGPLPAGWSPVAAVDVAPGGTILGQPASVSARNTLGVGAGALLAAAAWDHAAGAWRFIGPVEVEAGAPLTARVSATTQVVWLLPDVRPAPPPVQGAGELLTGVAAPGVPADATVTVNPQPKIAVYDPAFRALVGASLNVGDAVSSGVVLRARLSERYEFVDGPPAGPDPFVADLVFYQFPASGEGLDARFTVSPSIAFEAAALSEGVISVELRGAAAAAPALIGQDGGRVTTATGESFSLPAGVLTADVAASLERLSADTLGLGLPASLTVLGAVSLTLDGQPLPQSGVLAMPRPSGLVDEAGLLIVRLEDIAGGSRLRLVAVGRLVGEQVVSDVDVVGLSTPLLGIREGGRYLFLRLTGPFGFVAGLVRGVGGSPAEGALVATSTLPIVALSAADGRYAVPGLAGTNEVTAVDVATLDGAAASVAVAAGGIARLDLRIAAAAPAVTSVTPADGEANVALGSPVVVSFSEPIDPATIGGLVVEAGGQAVAGARTLGSGGRVLTFRATDALAPNTRHQVRVTAAVTDLTGRALAGEVSSVFTTLDTAPRPPPAAGTISASVPSGGQTTVAASQGTAGTGDTVRIYNLTRKTFQAALVQPNGSFEARLDARITDRLRVGITTPSGAETTFDIPRFVQQNPDGSISSSVDGSGGVLDGPGGIQLDVPEGAFPDGAIVTIDAVGEAAFPIKLTPAQKTLFSFEGGVRLDFGGAVPTRYLDLSIPAKGGETLEDRWVVGGVVQVAGQPFLDVADTASLVGDRIVTASPPCPGVMAALTYGFIKTVRPMGVVYGRWPNPDPRVAVADDALLFSTPYLGPDLSGATPWGVVVDGTPAKSSNICLPSLSGRVTVTPNTQTIRIPGTALTPADREVHVRNVATGQRFVYPRNVADFATIVEGALEDTYEVFAVTASGPVPVQFARKRRDPGFTEIRVDMDAVALATSAMVVRNTSRAPASEKLVPVSQLDVTVQAAGSASAADYEVKVVTAAEASRAVPFTVESPNGAGSLLLRVLPLTIDPGTVTVLRNRTTGTDLPIPGDAIVAGAGGVTWAFDGAVDHRYALVVSYPDNSQLAQAFEVPQIRVYTVNTTTGRTTATVNVPVPPQDEPFNLGAVSGDRTKPFVVGTPSNLSFFDPGGFLTFRFSEGLDRQSALDGIVLRDDQGNAVDVEIRLSERNQVVTVVPRQPLRLGREYSLEFAGVTDPSGNAVASRPIQVTVFEPRRIGPTFLTGQGEVPRHLELWRARDSEDNLKTFAMQGKIGFYVTEPVVTSFDLSDVDVPATLYEDTGGLRYFEIEDWAVATGLQDVPLSGTNRCTGQGTFTGTLGVMARQSQSSTVFGFSTAALDFFDLTDPARPCRIGGKNVAGTNLDDPGVYETVGYPKSVAVVPYEGGLLAFTAVQFVGLASVDVTRSIGNVPNTRTPLVPGNYRSVGVHGGRVIALEQTNASVDVFDASLTPLANVPLSGETEPFELAVADAFPVDRDEDGEISDDEQRTLVFVAGTQGIAVVDVTELGAAQQLTFVPRPGANRVFVDREGRRVIASGAGRWFILDFSRPSAFYPGSRDDDGDGIDDRIVWQSPSGLYVAGGGRLLALEAERGLVHVASGSPDGTQPPGVDTWALNSLCCDARIDIARNFDEKTVEGDRGTLIELEREALQQGMKAGLDAAGQCGVPLDRVSILEQGSGSCIWKDDPKSACQGNYQPGLSDHDYEVFIPDAFFAGTPGETPADCVAQTLSDQFINEDGTPKEIAVRGRTLTFDDITFFPFRRDGFDAGKINVLPPQNKSGDTSGDLAMGRQQLLLLWLLGGEYVDIPGYDVQGVPLAEIVLKLQTQTGIPALEGYEWANLQKFNLFKTKAFLRIAGASDPGSAFHPLYVKQLHDAGKAAIRTVFARMVADPRTNAFVTKIRRNPGDPGEGPAYTLDACRTITGPVPATWTPKPCAGFEDFVASTAARTVTELKIDLFTPEEIFDVVHKFWRVKGDVPLPARFDIETEADADRFLAAAARFVDATIVEAKAAYDAQIPGLPAPEQQQRGTNLSYVFDKTAKAKKGVTLQVIPRVTNAGFRNAEGLPIVMYRGIGTAPGARVKPKSGAPAIRVTLAGGESVFLDDLDEVIDVEDDAAERNLSDNEKYVDDRKADYFTLGDKGDPVTNPPLDLTAEPGVARWVAFTVDLDGPRRTVRESLRQNNYAGFYYYILDRDNPVPPVAPGAEVPLPVPDPAGTLLRADAECDPPSELRVTQSMTVDGKTYSDEVPVPLFKSTTWDAQVQNIGQSVLDGVQVCSTLVGECFDVGTLGPGDLDVVSSPWPADGTSRRVTANAIGSSADGGSAKANPLSVNVGCEEFTIVSLEPDPNPATGNSTVGLGGRSLRYYRVVRRERPEEALAGAKVTVEIKGPGVLRTDDYTTDERGIIGRRVEASTPGDPTFVPGIVVQTKAEDSIGAQYRVTVREVDNKGDCVSDVSWKVDVVPRTYQAVGAAGSALKLSKKFAELGKYGSFEGAAKGGYGLEVTLDAAVGGPDVQYAVSSLRSAGAEAAIKFEKKFEKGDGAKKTDLDFQVAGEQSFAVASAGATVGAELAFAEKFVFPAPLDADKKAGMMYVAALPVLDQIRWAGAQQAPLFTALVDALVNDPFDVEPYRVGYGGQLQASQEMAARLSGLTFSFGKVDELQIKDLGFNAGGAGSFKGTLTAGADLVLKPPRILTASIEDRDELNFNAGITAKLDFIANTDLPLSERARKSLDETLNRFLRTEGRSIGAVKFEVPVDVDTGKADKVVVTVTEQKKYGFVFLNDEQIEPEDRGDGFRRSVAYTINLGTPEKARQVQESLAIVAGLWLVNFNTQAAFAFTEDKIGEEIAQLITMADQYEQTFEAGSGKKYNLGLSKAIEKVTKLPADKLPFNGEYEVKFDAATKYAIARGPIVKGATFPLEQYDGPDPLIPTTGPAKILDILTDTEALLEKGVKGYKWLSKQVERGEQVLDSIIDFEFSPSGVTLQIKGSAEPADGPPLTVDLIAFQYRALSAEAAPLAQDATSVAGRADVPHNGVGGFFQFLPDGRALAAPATLTIRWLDEEVVGLDESSIRIYRWNAVSGEWDLVGGTVDAAGNSVTTTVDRLGLYTAAPAMPAGRITVTPVASAPSGIDQPVVVSATTSAVRMNTGGVVPDGTLFTVVSVPSAAASLVPFGTIRTADADPATDGVQVPTVGGVLQFAVEYPNARSEGRVLAWPARGGTAFLDQPLPVRPPQEPQP